MRMNHPVEIWLWLIRSLHMIIAMAWPRVKLDHHRFSLRSVCWPDTFCYHSSSRLSPSISWTDCVQTNIHHLAFCCTCPFLLGLLHVALNSHEASAPLAFTGPTACTSYPLDGKQIWFHRRAVSLELCWLGRSRATLATSTYPANQRIEACCFPFCSIYFSVLLYMLQCYCPFRKER